MKKIDISTPTYPKVFTFVDDEDFNKWYIHKSNDGMQSYVERKKDKRTIRMHRVILNAKDGYVVDHIDGDGLNNVKSNLRICTNTQNLQNRRLNKNSLSGYKGVCWDKKSKVWVAQIGSSCRNTKRRIGGFTCLIKAAKAYDEAASEAYGEFAKLNFERKIMSEEWTLEQAQLYAKDTRELIDAANWNDLNEDPLEMFWLIEWLLEDNRKLKAANGHNEAALDGFGGDKSVIDGFWEHLYYSYNVESREEIEKDCKESWAEGTSPLAVALHFVWKREPKVTELVEALEDICAVDSADGYVGCVAIANKALGKYKEKK